MTLKTLWYLNLAGGDYEATGLTALILWAWPLIDEAERVAELLLPQLASVSIKGTGTSA